jgi:transposase
VYNVQDWAEVHRLFHRESWSKTAIAEKLHMSRNTVDRLLGLSEPPRYERPGLGSALDSYVDDIVRMLEENPKAPATVILERLRPLGYAGGITVLKERLAKLRPAATSAPATCPVRSASSTGGTPASTSPWARGPVARPSGW